MTEPEPPRPPRDIHAVCLDHPSTDLRSWTDIYGHLLADHTGGTSDPADIIEPEWSITGTWV